MSENLEVFGYSSKIFRDDAAAKHIDEEKHMHPHELDLLTTIDRFDVRGLLEFPIDFKRATERREGNPLDEADFLEESRFGDLRADIDHDAEYRRLQEEIHHESSNQGKYANVQFSYDEPNGQNGANSETAAIDPNQDEKPFELPANLSVPKNVQMPKYQQEHDIIAKTAEWLAGQSMQMEILLKTKQAGNQKFSFLNFGDPLNDYYKVVKKAVADGVFAAKAAEEQKQEEPSDSETDSDSDGGGYLHPALLAGKAMNAVKNTEIEKRTPSPQPVVDESHPLYKIISMRRQREQEIEIEKRRKEHQAQIEAAQAAAATAVRVPPPDVCQTVDWVAKELATTDISDRTEKEMRFRNMPAMEFMVKGHPFFNYYQTILQRSLLTNAERAHSPPPPPSAAKIAYEPNSAPISFKINTDVNGAEKRKEEAMKKAAQIVQALEARKSQPLEMEARLAAKARERLIEENKKSQEIEREKRQKHEESIVILESANLVKQGMIPPPPTSKIESDTSDRRSRTRSRSRSRTRSRTPKRRRRSRSRSRSRRSRSRSRERSRKKSHKKKSRRRRRRSYSYSRSRSRSLS